MGIRDSLKEISRYKKHEKRDKVLEKDIIKSTISDGQFRTRYSSFVEALEKDLRTQLVELDRLKVFYKPNKTGDAKYFEQTTLDERITDLFEVKREPDGTYSYKAKELDFEV